MPVSYLNPLEAMQIVAQIKESRQRRQMADAEAERQKALDEQRKQEFALSKRATEQNLAAQQSQQEQASLLPEARQAATRSFAPDAELLRTIAPDEARQLRQDQAKQATDARELADQDAKRKANVQRFAAQMLQKNPESRDKVIRLLEAQKATPTLGSMQEQVAMLNDPQALAENLYASSSAVLGPPEAPPAESQPLDEVAKIVINEFGLRPGTPEYRQRYAAVRAELARDAERRAKAGATSVSVGKDGPAVGLTTSQQTTQQGEVIKADFRLRQLASIRKAIESLPGAYDAVGSYSDQAKEAISSVANKAGLGGDKAFLEKRAAAIASIGAFTNPIISELSGANVPESEMRRMRESLPRPEDPGPALKAKMDAWEQNLNVIRDYGVNALVNGIRTGKIQLPGEEKATTPEAGAKPDTGKRIRVKGPNGETGTVPEGTSLPEGWSAL